VRGDEAISVVEPRDRHREEVHSSVGDEAISLRVD
jgi:hypothetical protein